MKNKGITLIALVITIIILLILAGGLNSYANRGEWNIKSSKKKLKKKQKKQRKMKKI